MNIDLRKVKAVMLTDGQWYEVTRGTFDVGQPTRQTANWWPMAKRIFYFVSAGETFRGPMESIVTYRS
jgi:hypothetical protein